MKTPQGNDSSDSRRVRSHIPGLDVILRGGLFRGGVMMLMGRPGAGKTILGNQFAFNHARHTGGRVVYVTLLTESHARLLSALESLAFFDPAVLANEITYVSGFQAYEDGKLPGLLKLLSNTVREHRADLLIIDGLAGDAVAGDMPLRKFIHELQVIIELVGCTTLLLTGARDGRSNYAERTMVDGLIELSITHASGMRAVRQLEVLKHRGSAALLGHHRFSIDDRGVSVFPRAEAVFGRSMPAAPTGPRLQTGVAGLDQMLAGGVSPTSSTLILGATGTGKTVIGASFLCAGAAHGERGLHFGFFESRDALVATADAAAIPLARHLDDGGIGFMWHSPLDECADALAGAVIDAVRRDGVRRLFIDGVVGFEATLVDKTRLEGFVTAVLSELSSHGVTTLLSRNTPELLGPGVTVDPGISAVVDNIVVLRNVEMDARLHRLVSVPKMRAARADPQVRELTIGEHGPVVSSSTTLAKAAPNGRRRKKAASGRRSR